MRLQRLCLEKIQIENHHLLHADAVDDIAFTIRDIMVQKQNNDVLFKLYQYTMLFTKHERERERESGWVGGWGGGDREYLPPPQAETASGVEMVV